MPRQFFLFIALIALSICDANAATTVDGGSFDTIYDAFKAWVGGSLGLTIALLGMLGGIIIVIGSIFLGGDRYITPYGYVVIFGVPVVAGGLIGMVETMATLGRSTFG